MAFLTYKKKKRENWPTNFSLFVLISFLFSGCNLVNGQDCNITMQEFIDSYKKDALAQGNMCVSQEEGIQLYNMLQCKFGLPYSGYIVFDSSTTQKSYNEIFAVWLDTNEAPYLSIVGSRNSDDEIILESETLNAETDLEKLNKKPVVQKSRVVQNLRMDNPYWNSPNSFKIGVVSLGDYFSIGNIPIKDPIKIIGSDDEIRYKGFRFADKNNWEYEVRTTTWKSGPITKVVVNNLNRKEAFQIIQDYIDYVDCYPEPFFSTESLGQNPAKVYEKGELRVVEAYFQNTTPDYSVTIDYQNKGDGKSKLTFKRYNGYYKKGGIKKKKFQFPVIDKTYDVKLTQIDSRRWQNFLQDTKE